MKGSKIEAESQRKKQMAALTAICFFLSLSDSTQALWPRPPVCDLHLKGCLCCSPTLLPSPTWPPLTGWFSSSHPGVSEEAPAAKSCGPPQPNPTQNQQNQAVNQVETQRNTSQTSERKEHARGKI